MYHKPREFQGSINKKTQGKKHKTKQNNNNNNELNPYIFNKTKDLVKTQKIHDIKVLQFQSLELNRKEICPAVVAYQRTHDEDLYSGFKAEPNRTIKSENFKAQ